MTDQTNQEEHRLPTPEELAKFEELKAKRLEYFKKEVPNLEIQKQYEQLLTEIDELYLRRVLVEVRLAQIQVPEGRQKEESSKQSEEVLKEQPKEQESRKLKTV